MSKKEKSQEKSNGVRKNKLIEKREIREETHEQVNKMHVSLLTNFCLILLLSFYINMSYRIDQ